MSTKETKSKNLSRENPYAIALKRHKQSISESAATESENPLPEHEIETVSNSTNQSASGSQSEGQSHTSESIHSGSEQQANSAETKGVSIEQVLSEFDQTDHIKHSGNVPLHAQGSLSPLPKFAVAAVISALSIGGYYIYQNPSFLEDMTNTGVPNEQQTELQMIGESTFDQSEEAVSVQELATKYTAELRVAEDLVKAKEAELQELQKQVDHKEAK